MDLKRTVTLADIESEHPYLHDESHYKDTHEHWHWLELREEWLAFAALVVDGDAIWEYEDVNVHLGFASGSGGFLIKRSDTIVDRFATYAVG